MTGNTEARSVSYSDEYDPEYGIAIVGLAGRFPGARNVTEFWDNLLQARDTISRFTAEELDPAPVREGPARSSPEYVRARGVLDDAEMFDARFFGINPREAEVLDPQHRVFLETAWEALEDAGHDPGSFTGPIGVYAGADGNSYFLENLFGRLELNDSIGAITLMTSVQNDYLASRVAYKLDLRGPAITIQTACSTSLVAVCTAVQSLLSYQCDMALAGGIAIGFPQRSGYLWQEGSIRSPDGYCRAFDADAQGTVFSDGAGVVVLRRLQDAINDGDNIYAVIKGAAVNNDGSDKSSFTAPSVNGQASVISMAQAQAGIDPATISYIEAHGTGTAIGDPIEIAALTQAFRAGGALGTGFCAVGSLKTNVGHMDVAAGVGGLIKTALALRHAKLPATLHFRRPNPDLNLESSPFYINSTLQNWPSSTFSRRAGVSSLGVGGTNAHVVLEEAPPAPAGSPGRTSHLLLLSARSGRALDRATDHLRAHLQAHPEIDLNDVEYTLQIGRRAFAHRRAVVCSDHGEALRHLENPEGKRVFTRAADPNFAGVAFLFPGQGSQRVNMGRSLYESERLFAREVDECSDLLLPMLGVDLRSILYPAADGVSEAQIRIDQTEITQPALFVVEYALARLWMSWGIEPVAMIGHSLGEYVAATLAGVFSRDDALKLVAQRARMMQALPRGSMLAAHAGAEVVSARLLPGISIAAVNAPELTVVSGESAAIEQLESTLSGEGIESRRLATSHAFHSAMMGPIVSEFAAAVARVNRASPSRTWISSLTGEPITESQAKEPEYWAQQMRNPVRFQDGVGKLLDPGLALLETGPGQVLSGLARNHPSRKRDQVILASLAGRDETNDMEMMLGTAGRLWAAGAPFDWKAFHAGTQRRRISLPTYPFERTRYWIPPVPRSGQTGTTLSPSFPPQRGDTEPGQAHKQNDPVSSSPSPDAYAGLSATEKKIVAIWIDLLAVDSVSTDDNFFDLGGDSIQAVQLIARIEKTCGVRLRKQDLVMQSLAQLANQVDAAEPRPGGVASRLLGLLGRAR